MKDNNMWVIVLVALVVAVLASVVTVKLTGNTIAVPNSIYVSPNQTTLYTKAEIDTKVNGLMGHINILYNNDAAIPKDILSRLNKCVVVKDDQQAPQGVVSCDTICSRQVGGLICVLGSYQGNIISCSSSSGSIGTSKFCKCCG